jgi:uncharacterized protein (TIGR03382 family)
VQVGDPFVGYLTVRTDTAFQNNLTSTGYRYEELRLAVGSESYLFSLATLEIDNNGSFAGDRVDAEFSAGGLIGGLPFTHGRLRLVDTTNQALSSTSLVFTTDLSAWQSKEVRFYAQGVDIVGQMSSLTLTTIPAPAASPLLALAGLSARGRRRR